MARTHIGWAAWGPEAFETARRSGKHLFVVASAFWCEGGDHAARAVRGEGPAGPLIDESFVAVRVDADRNPEVVRRYGLTQLPGCAVLRPDGTLMARFAPAELHLHRGTLASLARSAVEVPAGPGALGLFPLPYVAPGESDLERGVEGIERIRKRVETALEEELSGPEAVAGLRAVQPLRFLLHYANDTGERRVLERAVTALHALGLSALYDAVEGGFFAGAAGDGSQTYKLTRANADWLILALRVSREPEGSFALPLARGILHYLQHRVCLPDGAFGLGQRPDAAYYGLTSEERRRVSRPAVEPCVHAAANLLAVRAFCKGWRVLGERAYLELALGTYAFVRDHLVAPDGSLAHWYEAGPHSPGHLDDLVEMGHALMALYHSTLEPHYLEGVRDVARRLVAEHLNPAGGGFLDLRLEARPPSVPGGPVVDYHLNARAAHFLTLAAAQLDDDSLGVVARSVLSVLLASGEPDLEGACLLGLGLLAALYPLAVFEVITDGSAHQRDQALEALRGAGAASALITHRLAERGEGMKRLPRVVAHCGHQRREIRLGEGVVGRAGGGA